MYNMKHALLNSSCIDIVLICMKTLHLLVPTGSDSDVLNTLGRMLPLLKKADSR